MFIDVVEVYLGLVGGIGLERWGIEFREGLLVNILFVENSYMNY